MAMNRFDELATFVDEIHKQLKEQDYIDLMMMMNRLRIKIETPRGADYLVDLVETLPILTYQGGNHYKIDKHLIHQSLVFNEKDICRIVCNDRQFDEKEFLACRGDCNITNDGQLEYNNKNRQTEDFILHDSECDHFGTHKNNCDCSCLEYDTTTTKITNIEKL